MKQPFDRKTTPLEDAKLERLATLLGEFLARAWLRHNRNDAAQSDGRYAISPSTIDTNSTSDNTQKNVEDNQEKT